MKKGLKQILSLLLITVMIVSCAAGCVSEKTEESKEESKEASKEESKEESIEVSKEESLAVQTEPIRIGTLKGPSTMGMVKLMEDNEAEQAKLSYEFTLAGSPDELTPKFIQGNLDIIAVPANLGAILYKNTDGAVQNLTVNATGLFYILEKGGESIHSLEDLKGKTIYSNGKGGTPEFSLNYLLKENGLDPEKDVTIEWKSEAAEVVASISAMDQAIAMLPQPFVTVASAKLPDLRVALSLDEEWNKLNNGSALITTVMLVRTDFAKEHSDLLQVFIDEYTASNDFTNENPAEAAQLIGKYGIVDAAVAEKAIPYCNLVCVTGEEMKTMLSGYLSVLSEQSPESVGGALPGEDFYYIGK